GQASEQPWGHLAGAPGNAATGEERNWALVAHLGALVTAWFAFGFIAPLLTLLLKGNTSPFVRRHSIASLNFQLSMLIYSVVGTILMLVLTLVTLGLALVLIIPLLGVVLLVLLTFVIIGSVRAMAGEEYTYPFALRLVT
ncbi:MAG: DUF4870 domain-containing protein, partial [Nocardioides sp.]|nr:DUF4870 domain-containing protein [Nocardioides sp.]